MVVDSAVPRPMSQTRNAMGLHVQYDTLNPVFQTVDFGTTVCTKKGGISKSPSSTSPLLGLFGSSCTTDFDCFQACMQILVSARVSTKFQNKHLGLHRALVCKDLEKVQQFKSKVFSIPRICERRGSHTHTHEPTHTSTQQFRQYNPLGITRSISWRARGRPHKLECKTKDLQKTSSSFPMHQVRSNRSEESQMLLPRAWNSWLCNPLTFNPSSTNQSHALQTGNGIMNTCRNFHLTLYYHKHNDTPHRIHTDWSAAEVICSMNPQAGADKWFRHVNHKGRIKTNQSQSIMLPSLYQRTKDE